jgi:hypothetical protein
MKSKEHCEASSDKPLARKKYAKPVLEVYGNLTNITAARASRHNDDGSGKGFKTGA